jgi:hypothetical protein
MSNRNSDRQRLLRLALTCNALFSLSSGLVIAFADRQIVRVLGLPSGNSLLSLGIGLIVFAIFLFLSARRQLLNIPQTRIMVLLDIVWVVGSYALLFVVRFSSTGKWLVGIVAEFVLAFAVAQWLGIRHCTEATRKGQQHA